MSQPLLKCEHVDFGYENYDVVKDVSLEICQGDYLCIVGENGSGKSTLMKGLLGLLKPTGGSLMVSDDLKRSGHRISSPADAGPEGFSGHRPGGGDLRLSRKAGEPSVLLKKRKGNGGSEHGASGDHRSEKELLPGSFRRPEARTLIARPSVPQTAF